MVAYNKVNVKLPGLQFNKLKSVVKDQTGVILRMNTKIFNGSNLPCEILLTSTQKTKLRTAFVNNKPTDIKLSKFQISNITQPGEFLGSLSSKRVVRLMKVAV